MAISLQRPEITELKPRITVFGVGGGGGNAVNNMITAGLRGVEFVCANTDAQALAMSKCERLIQLGAHVTEGLGAGSQPEVGRAAAEECLDEILDHLSTTHMCFVTAGMGGGTGTGAAPVVARAAREKGILTVGVVTKPFHFEGQRRMRLADQGIEELQKCVDTLIVIPNQNLFRLANDKTTFADAFAMADQVLYSGVACITDLMVKEGLINLDFADVRSVMREMGKAMMGTGEASGEGRAMAAAEAAISNPLLDETSMKGARGLLISITGGRDLTLFEVDEAATRIREEVDSDANIILGATFDEELEGVIRVSVVATGIDKAAAEIASAPISLRPAAPKPAPTQQQRAVQEMAPVAEVPAYDPVAEAMRQAEAEVGEMVPLPIAAEDYRPQPRATQPVAQPNHGQHATPSLRMPRVEDFPPMVQAEVTQGSRQPAPADEDRGPLGLLRKLTSGLSSRREEETAARLQPAQPREPKLRQAGVPDARRPASRDDAQLYAPRRGQLDDQGRAAPRARSEEDNIDIPAFLRRQAN